MPIPIPLSNADTSTGPPVNPTPGGTAYLTFYLIPQQLGADYYQHMVACPYRVTFEGHAGMILLAAMTDNAQHVAILGTYPAVSGWTGTAREAANVLRANGLTHLWWMFDWFIAKHGIQVRIDDVVVPPDPSPFVPADYAAAVVAFNPDGAPLDMSLYQVTEAVVPIEGGVDVTYTITNIGSQDANWPSFRVPIPVLDYQAFWTGDHKWKRFDGFAPYSGISVFDANYGLGIPNGVTFQTLALDTEGGSGPPATVGWGCDYPYFSFTNLPWYFPYKIVTHPNGFLEGGRTLPVYLRPGETRTITFWLRYASGTGLAKSLQVVQPYVAFIRSQCPTAHPPKLRGRIAGTLVADSGGDPAHRYYRSYMGTRVDQFDGWNSFLQAVCAQNYTSEAHMVANDYRALMLWTTTGFLNDNVNDFVSDIRDLPPNLASTMHEIAEWEASTGLKLFIWAGRALVQYQVGGWDTTELNSLRTGYYTGVSPSFTGPLPEGWQAWSLEPDAELFFLNVHRYILSYVSGMGYDAMPEPISDPWVQEEIAKLRAAFPNAYMFGENAGSDRKCQWVPPYFNFNEFEGRCPLMDLIHPNYEPLVQTGGSINPEHIALSLAAEAAGAVVVTHGPILTDPYVPYPYP